MNPVHANRHLLERKLRYWEWEAWGYFRSAAHFWTYWLCLLNAFTCVVALLVLMQVKG